MKAIDVTLCPSLFDSPAAGPQAPAGAVRAGDGTEVHISLTVEPAQVQVPGRARVVIRVRRQGQPLDGFPLSISSSRGHLSSSRGSTRAGVLSAEIQGHPEDVGTALVRVHSDLWEAQAVLSAGVEFVR